MRVDFMESQIEERKRSDEEMFQGAFSDLLSVVGIDLPKVSKQAKGALTEILTYLGRPIPSVPESIDTLDAQLDYMLRPSNTMRRRVELKGEWWKDCTGCLLGSTKKGNVVAIIPSKWSGYEYVDPETGKKERINKETAKNINLDAFCFYKAFPLKSLKMRDLFKFMIENLSYSDVFFMISAALVMQLLGIFSTYVNKMIVEYLIPSNTMSLILPFASFFGGLTIGSLLIGMTKTVIENRFHTKISLVFNSAIMMRFFSLPTKFFKDYTAGELASRMGYIAELCHMIVSSVFSTGLATVFSLSYVVPMCTFAPGMVIPGLLITFISIGYSVLMIFYKQSIYKKKLDLDPKLMSLTYALFGGIQKIKVAGAEKRAFAKWAENYSNVAKLAYSPPLLIKLDGVISLVIGSVGTMVLYYFAIVTKVDTANYYAFNQAYGAVTAAIASISGVALQFASMGPILKMIKPVMEQEPENGAGKKIPLSLSGDIEISNLSFKYEEKGPTILDNINLKIKKGEYVAIVGKTGCGKSTLMRLLLGFETPNKGAIYYDGRDLAKLDLRSVRQKIGVVMQNGSLFPGDIFSNIIITAPWKTMDDAWEAAEMAGVYDDIKAMPMGMHTLISEGSGGISGGQKQRIMIARAVINRPQVLFFDEATSALDNITQNHVAKSIEKLNSTRLVIAHRLSTIKNCDRILVMDGGKIVEEGTYDELMSQKGMFYDLAIRQVVE